MHSIAHLLLFGSMVAAAIGALTFCLVLGAFGFTPAEGQPDEVARRERLARIGRLIAGTGFGLAALFGVVGVAASPPVASSVQPQLTALRDRMGDMTTRLGHIAELADHLRVHIGDWTTAAVPRRREAPAAIPAGRAVVTLPDRSPASDATAASVLPERGVRVSEPSVLPHTVTSREIRATAPEPSPRRQLPVLSGDVRSGPVSGAARPVARPTGDTRTDPPVRRPGGFGQSAALEPRIDRRSSRRHSGCDRALCHAISQRPYGSRRRRAAWWWRQPRARRICTRP